MNDFEELHQISQRVWDKIPKSNRNVHDMFAEEVIKAGFSKRKPQHRYRNSVSPFVFIIVLLVAMAGAVYFGSWALSELTPDLVKGLGPTGPDCPNMDPAWLGRCE